MFTRGLRVEHQKRPAFMRFLTGLRLWTIIQPLQTSGPAPIGASKPHLFNGKLTQRRKDAEAQSWKPDLGLAVGVTAGWPQGSAPWPRNPLRLFPLAPLR